MELNTTPGPGSKDNDVMKHFLHGKSTNSWAKLLRKTSYLFIWRAKMKLKNQGIKRLYTRYEFGDMVEALAGEMA